MERFYQGRFYLALERDFCKGCALCVKSCEEILRDVYPGVPNPVLYLDAKGKIAVNEINNCVFCGVCEARCPDFAIWIVKSAGENPTEDERVRQR